MTRSDLRTYVRDDINEEVADLFSDARINRYYLRELRSLPTRGVYKEEIWRTTLVVDQQDYTLPTKTYEIERIERNDGTSSQPDWNELKGWDMYGSAVYFNWNPTSADSIRARLRMKFDEITDDVTALDIDEDKAEALTAGIVVRCYEGLIGYLKGNKSWDSVTKPGDLSIPVIQAYLRDARSVQDKIVAQFSTTPEPRDIGLID